MWKRALISLVLPFACAWVRKQEALILQDGVPLNETEHADAVRIGIVHPERIRLLKVASVPMPVNPLLRRIGERFGLMTGHAAGMAMRYGIFVRADSWRDPRLI